MKIKAMVNGVWHSEIEDTPAFRERRAAERARDFHHRITTDDGSDYPAEPGRYHLYISYACPWAHKTVIYRAVKGLTDIVSMSTLEPSWSGPNGWTFGTGDDPAAGATRDHVNGFAFLYEVYRMAKPDFTGKVTVPVLFDTESRTIVSTESGEIMRMFEDSFRAIAPETPTFRPERLRPAIEALNAFVLDRICMGVYRAGFADDQTAYDKAVVGLFAALDELEVRLANRNFLFGDRVTETDWHLFATLIRFDAVYYGALRCNLRRLVDYPNLWAYTRRLFAYPGVAATVRLDHVKRHYYDDLRLVNPTIVPAGPVLDFGAAAA